MDTLITIKSFSQDDITYYRVVFVLDDTEFQLKQYSRNRVDAESLARLLAQKTGYYLQDSIAA